MTLSFPTPGRFIPTLSLTVCLPPRSFLPLQVKLTGQPRLLYVRAERASLPSHASDMLSARLQAIGGTRTFTSQDSQLCRLLTPSPSSLRPTVPNDGTPILKTPKRRCIPETGW